MEFIKNEITSFKCKHEERERENVFFFIFELGLGIY